MDFGHFIRIWPPVATYLSREHELTVKYSVKTAIESSIETIFPLFSQSRYIEAVEWEYPYDCME